MLAPGVPSAAVADALTRGRDWAKDIVDATMRQRYGPAGNAVRFLPPLTISAEILDEGLGRFEAALAEIAISMGATFPQV